MGKPSESLIARSRAHLESVDESYGAHQRFAFGVGWTMVKAGLACILHGLVPALFPTTGSDAIRRLHGVISDRERIHEIASRREGLSVLLLLALVNAAVPWLAGAPVLVAAPLSLLSLAFIPAYWWSERLAEPEAA
ncbi:DUF6356 family protein [Allosphingosinicella sp.]|uniref:DUF6356 family protein n=1 Tax=Allosphingosinicella sp. TaxID=2823234 RepID=UPI003784AC16